MKKNFLILLLSQIGNQALTALAGLLIIHALSPSEYGGYSLAVAGLNVGSVVSDAGLSSFLNREAARTSPERSRQLWLTALRLRLGLALLVGLATIGLTWIFAALGQPLLAALADLALFPATISALTTALLNGEGRIKRSAGINSLTVVINLGLTVLVIWWGSATATVLLLVNVLVVLVSAVLLIYPLLTRTSSAELNDPQTSNSAVATTKETKIVFSWWQVLQAGKTFWFIGLASLVFQYLDLYIVSLLLDKTAVGQYGAALRLLAFVTAIPTVWGIAAMPRFARQPYERQSELIRWGFLLTGVGIGLALASTIIGGPVIDFLLGSRYQAVSQILPLFGWAAAGIFAGTAPVIWLTVTDRQRYILWSLILSDGLGLGLCLVLAAGLQWGLPGIALARIATSWSLSALYLIFARTEKVG